MASDNGSIRLTARLLSKTQRVVTTLGTARLLYLSVVYTARCETTATVCVGGPTYSSVDSRFERTSLDGACRWLRVTAPPGRAPSLAAAPRPDFSFGIVAPAFSEFNRLDIHDCLITYGRLGTETW